MPMAFVTESHHGIRTAPGVKARVEAGRWFVGIPRRPPRNADGLFHPSPIPGPPSCCTAGPPPADPAGQRVRTERPACPRAARSARIKVPTRRAAEVPRAQAIYEQGLNQGQSFDQIERALAEACPELKSPLVPRNAVVHRACPGLPEPRTGDADPRPPWRGPRRGAGASTASRWCSPTDRWQSVMPHELATWGARDKRFWSEYSTDGRWRHCMTHAPVPVDATGRRTVRLFGGRRFRARTTAAGQLESRPEYQQRQCNLTGRFLFFIPGIRSISAFELHTRSFYAMNAAIRTFETVAFPGGGRRVPDRQGTPFYPTKAADGGGFLASMTMGRPVRVPQ